MCATERLESVVRMSPTLEDGGTRERKGLVGTIISRDKEWSKHTLPRRQALSKS